MDSVILCLSVASLFLRGLLWGAGKVCSAFLCFRVTLCSRVRLKERRWNDHYQYFCQSSPHCSSRRSRCHYAHDFPGGQILNPRLPKLNSPIKFFITILAKVIWIKVRTFNQSFPSITLYISQFPVLKYNNWRFGETLLFHCFSVPGNHREGGRGGARCVPRAEPWLPLLDTLKDLERALLH